MFRKEFCMKFCLTVVIIAVAVFAAGCDQDTDEKNTNIDNKEDVSEQISSGVSDLEKGNFDAAINAFESAYAQNKTDPEAIVYSTLGYLVSIPKDQSVRNLMTNRFGIKNYPATIEGLLDYESWFVSYTEEYNDGESAVHKLPDLDVPSWFSGTNLYKESLTGGGLKSPFTFSLLMMVNLIDKNTNGLNVLIDEILSAVFGSKFESAYDRIAALNSSVKISKSTLEAFELGDLLDDILGAGEEIFIGKAELYVTFAYMRILKANLEWISSFNLNTSLEFLKNAQVWDDFSKSKPADLPLRNNFLADRGNGGMTKSKENFIKAIDDLAAVYDIFFGSNSTLPEVIQEELENSVGWAKSALTQLKTSINNNGIFWVKEPSGNTYNNNQTDASFGIDFGKFFTPGTITANKLIESTGSGAAAKPIFYGATEKFYDYNTGEYIRNYSNPLNNKNLFDNWAYIGFKFKFSAFSEIIKDVAFNDEIITFLDPEDAKIIWDWYN